MDSEYEDVDERALKILRLEAFIVSVAPESGVDGFVRRRNSERLS